MKFKFIVSLLGLLFVCHGYANGVPLKLEKAHINVNDKASLMRGAEFYKTNCMVCHAVKYLQYNKLAQKAGITLDKMPLKDQEWWFGAAPPDLSLVARVRTPDWLVTYLHSFYQDNNRPLGTNNLLVDNSSMPNPFGGLQGTQVLTVPYKTLLANHGKKQPYYAVLKKERPGSMSADEFDTAINDLVNFLVYAGEPAKVHRESLGWWVLGFLVVLLILAYFLKREYWKDVTAKNKKQSTKDS